MVGAAVVVEAPAPEAPEDKTPRGLPHVDDLHAFPFDDEAGAKVIDVADPVALSSEDVKPLVAHFRMVLIVPAPEDLSMTDRDDTMRHFFG